MAHLARRTPLLPITRNAAAQRTTHEAEKPRRYRLKKGSGYRLTEASATRRKLITRTASSQRTSSPTHPEPLPLDREEPLCIPRSAWSRAACHSADRVADTEMRGVRKLTSGTGDACRIISAFVAHLIRTPMCRSRPRNRGPHRRGYGCLLPTQMGNAMSCRPVASVRVIGCSL